MAQDIDFGVLEDILQDPDVTKVMINSADSIYYWHKWEGHKHFDKQFDNPQQLHEIAVAIAEMGGVELGVSNPIVETRLPDGTRAILIVPPATPQGAVIRIDKQLENDMTMERLVEIGATSQVAADFIQACVKARLNIAIVGGYSSGKTTFLNVLVNAIPQQARVVVVQQIADLSLNHPDKVILETRKANVNGEGAITNRQLLETALQLDPHRIILSELDGTEGAVLLHAMNIGHHAMFAMSGAGGRDALSRLENAVASDNLSMPLLSIREQLAKSLDLIIHVELFELGDIALRRMMSVAEVRGMQGDSIELVQLFERPRDRDELIALGEISHLFDKISARGIEVDESWFKA